jgi:hypothetical protein
MLAVDIIPGFHVPVIAGVFVELNGRIGAILPTHKGPMLAKVGSMEVVISISIVVILAHCPASGLKV